MTEVNNKPPASIYKQADTDGKFKRQDAQFRNTISKDGKHQPEKGRYLLYANLLCPWACRTLITRSLKGLEDIIDVSILHYTLTENGWTFESDTAEATGDPLFGAKYIKEIYHKANPDYKLRYTVPVLFDKKLNTIVNNESSEIIRIFNEAFDELLPTDSPKRGLTFYPEDLRQEIDGLNEWVYHNFNNGVYKTGFATKQEVYEESVLAVFESLDKLEKILSDGRKYLVGGRLTEADIRTYVTAVRFDTAYHTKFKCNIKMIRHDYPNVHRWLRHMYWDIPEFKKWTNFDHIKGGYYYAVSDGDKAGGIVPLGPKPHILPKDA
ncbi:hypothetical protein YB2330_003113 [Saitoella coloradoensis]